MRQFRKATIRDVAARSKVSTTTISNFVSGNVNICSPETALRIREAIAALQYVPSSLTRGLRQRSSKTVGVCLPSPLDPDVSFGISFLERIWRGIVRAADIADYSLLHFPASVRDGLTCDAFLDGRVDGILLSAEDNLRAELLAEAGMPTVLIARSLDIPHDCGSIWADETDTVELAIDHLWKLGHRRIAYIAGPIGALRLTRDLGRTAVVAASDEEPARPAADIAVNRFNAYIAGMRDRGAYDPQLVAFAQAWSAPEAERYLARWQAETEPATAVVCTNDAQALDVIAAATRAGLSVPNDLSIIGVDNAPEAQKVTPGLSSVEVPLEDIGFEAFQAFLNLHAGAPVEQCRTAIPVTDLHARGSTASIAR